MTDRGDPNERTRLLADARTNPTGELPSDAGLRRRARDESEVPALIVPSSGDGEVEATRRFSGRGFAVFVATPFSADDLAATIATKAAT